MRFLLKDFHQYFILPAGIMFRINSKQIQHSLDIISCLIIQKQERKKLFILVIIFGYISNIVAVYLSSSRFTC